MDVLDLTHLDEEERRVIMAVIKRDEEFEKSENERIRRLKNSVETQRRTGQVSPAIERGLLARTGDWFSKRYRSVIGATPLVKMSLLREKKVSSTPFQTEPSENNVMQKKDPIDKRQPISEPQSERILAPVTISSFPPLVTKEVHERPMQPSNVDDTPFPHQVKPSYEKGDSSSSSPIISSDESEPEMKQKGHSHPPQDELNGQPPKRFFKSRLATDTRFQKVLPDLSAQKLPPARVPVMDRSQHGTPPQSPRVPPQRHNTPHSPLGSKETSPQSSPIIFGTFTARRHASPEATRRATGEIATLLSQTREDSPSPHQSAESSPTAHRRREASPTNNAPRTRSREPSPLVQRKNDEAAPAVAISLASGKNVEREEQIEVLSRQTSGTSSVSSGSQAESALQQVQSEGYLSPFGGGLKKKSKSKESLTLSTYSLAGKGKSVAVTGELYFGVRYNHLSNQLEVNIVEARGLAPADSSGTSDPYVKTYLLPDKSKESKRKTQIVKKSLNPVFNKSLTYKLKKEDVGLRRLWIAIYDWDRFGSNTFLGEVRIDLSKHDLTSGVPQWYKLQELDPDEGRPANRGELLLAIRFVPPDAAEGQQEKKKKKKKELKGDFQVLMKRARNLTAMDSSGLSDPFVKCYLLPDKSRSGKHKTKTIFRDLNPIWEEMLVYKGVTLEALRHRVLEVTVWDFDRAGSNDFIGGLRLGLSANQLSVEKKKLEPWMDAREDEAAQWQEMIENPNTFIGKWHVLRSTMDPRH